MTVMKQVKRSAYWGLMTTLMGFLIACGSDERSSTTVEGVTDQYVKMAYAAFNDSLNTAQRLKAAVDQFIAEPTETHLNTAKAAYKIARIPYQQAEIMRWDSPIAVGKKLNQDGGLESVDAWEGQVNAWPLDENHIETIIASDQTINTQLLISQNGMSDNGQENEANVTTGIHAIEFMLWGADTNGIKPGAGRRPASDFSLTECDDTLCGRRREYLSAATNLLVDDLTKMVAEWAPEAVHMSGTLAFNFINSPLAMDYIWGSIAAMAGNELSGARMNAGITTGDPEEEHDCFSDLSHVANFYNFIGIKNAFFGDYGHLKGPGIGDLVKEKDEKTYELIVNKLSDIEMNMQRLFDLGERASNPIRFDQIIGQDETTGAERKIAVTAINDLILFTYREWRQVKELLSLSELNTGASDGD